MTSALLHVPGLAGRFAVGVALTAVLVASLLVRGGETPHMRVETPRVSAGDHVLVRFDAPVKGWQRGSLWLTLVPVGSAERFVGERVVIDEGDVEATIAAREEGPHELRLIVPGTGSAAPIARASVHVMPRVTAKGEPPAWYW